MPSFNQGRFIEEAICSVLDQDYPDIELIVMDGGSKDQTVSILQKYHKRLAHWVSEPDRGQAHAVNKGLARATGQIVGWLNSDDKYVKGAFRKVSNAFLRNPAATLIHGDRILLDDDSQVSGWSCLPAFNPETTGFIVCSETAFWRSEPERTLREDLHFAMDLEFFSRMYLNGSLVKLNEFLGYFRCHVQNKSSTIPEVGQFEGEREWKLLFGPEHDGWKKRPSRTFWRELYALAIHPLTLTLPYAYRRLVRGRRGL